MLCHSSFSSVGKTPRSVGSSLRKLCHSSFSSVGKTRAEVAVPRATLCHSSFSSVGKTVSGERSVQARSAKPSTATERSCGRQIKRRTGKAKLLNFQASTGDTGDAGAPGKRATDKESRRLTRRETEGGGRGQRRSRRATDGARSGSRLPWRLCGLQCGLLQASKRPSVQASSR